MDRVRAPGASFYLKLLKNSGSQNETRLVNLGVHEPRLRQRCNSASSTCRDRLHAGLNAINYISCCSLDEVSLVDTSATYSQGIGLASNGIDNASPSQNAAFVGYGSVFRDLF